MRLSMILSIALAGLAFARPQRGSMNVLGFCVCDLLEAQTIFFIYGWKLTAHLR